MSSIQEPVNSIRMNLGDGPVEVSFVYHYGEVDTVWVGHRPPVFSAINPVEYVAGVLGLDSTSIDSRWPVQEVSTGLPFVMVPLKSLSAMRSACIIPVRYGEMVELTGARALYLFAPETYNPENDFNVRMFAPSYGISEDPATGAGAGCLAAYILRYVRPETEAADIRIEQGYEMGRPAILLARARRSDGGMRVVVGGRVAAVAQGHFV